MHMKCTKVQNLLRAYLDGELQATEQASIAAHLLGCDLCRAACQRAREFDEYLREVDDYLGEAPGLMVPPDFLPRVMRQVRAEATPLAAAQGWSVRQWFLDFSAAMRLVVASLILLAVFGGLRTGQEIAGLIVRLSEQQQLAPASILDVSPAEQVILQLAYNDVSPALGRPD